MGKFWGKTKVVISGMLVLGMMLYCHMESYAVGMNIRWGKTNEVLFPNMADGMAKESVKTMLTAQSTSDKTEQQGPGIPKFLGGGTLTMLTNKTASQMMSVVIETSAGSLIVIDGGTEGDAGHLINTLRNKGGRVSAWLITHPHSDHVGALNRILNDSDSQIVIEGIYYSFADLPWYYENEEYRADMVAQLMQTFQGLSPEILHGDIDKGQEIWVDDARITVLNRPYLFAHNAINNSSVAFAIEMNGTHIVFPGDMGQEAGDMLMAEYADTGIPCDILQMTHHGQYGVSEEVYRFFNPKVCLWPTPGWLWNNDMGRGKGTGPWFTLETRAWMNRLGVEYHYCIKDGDQVLR